MFFKYVEGSLSQVLSQNSKIIKLPSPPTAEHKVAAIHRQTDIIAACNKEPDPDRHA